MIALLTLIAVILGEVSSQGLQQRQVCSGGKCRTLEVGLIRSRSLSTGSCESLPDGWIIPWGVCSRYFSVCSRGSARRMDCLKIAKKVLPGVHFGPNEWVFDSTRKLCTKFGKCLKGNVSAPSASSPTVSTAAVAQSCIPGSRFAMGRCERTYLQCAGGDHLEKHKCPGETIFDSKARICLHYVDGCPRNRYGSSRYEYDYYSPYRYESEYSSPSYTGPLGGGEQKLDEGPEVGFSRNWNCPWCRGRRYPWEWTHFPPNPWNGGHHFAYFDDFNIWHPPRSRRPPFSYSIFDGQRFWR